LDPNDTRPIWNRAECYKSIKNYSAAVEDFKKVYELNNSYYNTLYSAGECYELMNNKPLALEYYSKFKSLASTDNEYYKTVDQKISKLGKYKEPK
jgi:tetratricopeptide (TPR) repeat protein